MGKAGHEAAAPLLRCLWLLDEEFRYVPQPVLGVWWRPWGSAELLQEGQALNKPLERSLRCLRPLRGGEASPRPTWCWQALADLQHKARDAASSYGFRILGSCGHQVLSRRYWLLRKGRGRSTEHLRWKVVGSLSQNSINVVIFAFPINTTMFWPQFNRSDSTLAFHLAFSWKMFFLISWGVNTINNTLTAMFFLTVTYRSTSTFSFLNYFCYTCTMA